MLNIEKLAELEHQQWEYWSKNIAGELEKVYSLLQTNKVEDAKRILIRKIRRWRLHYWKPYSELAEEAKEMDRVWARKLFLEARLTNDNNRPIELFKHYAEIAKNNIKQSPEYRLSSDRKDFSNYILNIFIVHYGLRCTCDDAQDWDFKNASSHYPHCDLWKFCHTVNRCLDWAENNKLKKAN